MVTAVSYSNFRKSLKAHMRQVNEDADMLLVTNTDPADNVVVMSAADYESLMETIRIYQNPYLHSKVLRGLDLAQQGNAAARDLIDADGHSEQ
ncbi:type II toxin-antitoxin system prevent-host-death family antitoxin [Actinomycetaceae bacterium WB03_NA08]|uniref:Antitoxin n=2 Tax=Scrofimicrobium canadense TaxID=2652290 RepID=A0A6N7W527_9ACTO|nr:type II toxin-antitoxin system prevent-host-death family antitoxin [Scrofimicrobium canadense]